MIFLNILIILFALGFLGYGILLLFGNRWLPKFKKFTSYKPTEEATVTKTEIWWFRARGIFHIVISLYLLALIVIPGTNLLILLFIAVIATIASVVMVAILAHRLTKKEKADPEK